MSRSPAFVAVDIGNARLKLGLFAGGSATPVPEPLGVLALAADGEELERIGPWLAEHAGGGTAWFIASVNRPAADRLADWLGRRGSSAVKLLAADDFPLTVRLPEPERMGIDRVADAAAVNRLRRPDRAAVIVDAGTAITVDALSCDGALLGGAILPGMAMSARALHEHTDLLPLADPSASRQAPPALGTNTVSAIESGLFWGALGAIRELAGRLQETMGGPAEIFFTGGAGAMFAGLLGPAARCVPNLALIGIALAAERILSES